MSIHVHGFWEVFWTLGRVFGFWESKCLGFGFWEVNVLDSGKPVFPYKPRADIKFQFSSRSQRKSHGLIWTLFNKNRNLFSLEDTFRVIETPVALK